MARAHLFRPVTDEKGNLLYGAQVTVRKADFAEPIVQTLYAGPLDSATALDNPYVADAGYVDIWLDTPERVNLLIESAGRDPITLYLDVNPPAPEVVRTLYPLTINNAAALGQVLTGIDETTAQWSDPPTITPGSVPAHDHDGTGSMSTALGTGTTATGARATAVGDSATANFDDATAFGYQAVGGAIGATVFGAGASATAEDATAVGAQSFASGAGAVAVGRSSGASGVRATAIGKGALAGGDSSVALGPSAQSGGDDAVAIGSGAQALGVGSAAVGRGATALNQRSVAIGTMAATDEDDQVALGAPGSVTVMQDMVVTENAKVGAAGSLVGFFGKAGIAQPEITGVVSDPILFSLLTYLDSIGIIKNSATSA